MGFEAVTTNKAYDFWGELAIKLPKDGSWNCVGRQSFYRALFAGSVKGNKVVIGVSHMRAAYKDLQKRGVCI